MSKFVNYKKRSITLPLGCKNLSDLLKAPGAHGPVSKPDVVAASGTSTGGTTGCAFSFSGGISDVEKYVSMVVKSSESRSVHLVVSQPGQEFTINVARMGDEMSASVDVQAGSNQEKAVRSFLSFRGFKLPSDSEIMPPQFSPDFPWQTACEISPLPREARLVSILVADLLHDALGVKDDSPLCFYFSEI